jgi:hypothetical protein
VAAVQQSGCSLVRSEARCASIAGLLEQTLDALSCFDAERLEELAAQAEDMPVARPIEVRALRNTLCELLRSTDANLRLLRELRTLRVTGLRSDEYGCGDVRWVR